MNIFKVIIHSTRPSFLLLMGLFYALGVGMARYLGALIQWDIVFLGFIWALLIQLFAYFIFDYFRLISGKAKQIEGVINLDELSPSMITLKRSMLVAALSCLAIATSISILIIDANAQPIPVLMIMLMSVMLVISCAVPPLELSYSGYGELLHSVLISIILPAFAFQLQIGEYHRLLAMTTFPLFTFYLSLLISIEFTNYAHDLKFSNKNMLIRIGWQNGMTLHNILILCGYLLFGVCLFLGMPVMIGMPVFITLPLGMLQIWQMKRIADGYKPNWRGLTISSYFVISISTYLLAYSYWIR